MKQSNPQALHMTLIDADHTKPNFSIANKSSTWRATMVKELDTWIRNKTWTLVPQTPDMTVVGCKWVYKNQAPFKWNN